MNDEIQAVPFFKKPIVQLVLVGAAGVAVGVGGKIAYDKLKDGMAKRKAAAEKK